ncbi:MAG: hypothetical protein HY512_02190 [Candidatus Aenigmarchaeota archaeon]|nr:hypothetical protein [Candidatus Aenigmarchaeota archaeon]
MKPFYLILGVLFIVASGIAILSPLNKNETLAGASLSISTFLFGVFIAFSISDRHNRINGIRENDSNERSGLEYLYAMLEIFGKKAQNKIKTKIDAYLVATMDYTIWDYSKTEKQFKDLVKTVISLELKSKAHVEAYNSFAGIIKDLWTSRKQTISLIEDRLSKTEWLVFFVLSGIMVFSLLLIGTTILQGIVIVILTTFTIILLLILLYRLDNLTWKEEARIFEPYQQTFESVGLMRYYPESLIHERRIKKNRGKTYRLGIFPSPYPDMNGKKVKIVKV